MGTIKPVTKEHIQGHLEIKKGPRHARGNQDPDVRREDRAPGVMRSETRFHTTARLKGTEEKLRRNTQGIVEVGQVRDEIVAYLALGRKNDYEEVPDTPLIPKPGRLLIFILEFPQTQALNRFPEKEHSAWLRSVY